jgi:AcrR family transcriptional regulator
MSPRVRYRFDERRQRLLETGLEVFSSRPYDEISMDELAARAGVSKGLLYHYFPTKRDFYREALASAVEEMRRLTEPDPDLPPGEQLRAGLTAFLDYVGAHAAGFQALVGGGIGSDPEIGRIVDGFRQTVMERVVRGLGVGQPGPELRLCLRAWLGFTEAAALAWIEEAGVERDLVARMAVRALHAAVQEATPGPTGSEKGHAAAGAMGCPEPRPAP